MESQTKTGLGSSFVSLNVTQFLGALNDNLFKLLLIFFLIDRQGGASAGEVTALAGIVFVVPFLFFAPLAGMLADRLKKNRLIVGAKVLEVAVMVIGTAAFAFESAPGLYTALFLMALQSTLFGPAKYGIVPELVSRENLSRANGIIEAFTYLAIILGTTAATLIPLLTGRYTLSGIICVVIATAGFAGSLGIRQAHAPETTTTRTRMTKEIGEAWQVVRHDRHLAMAIGGSSLFMLVGAFVQMNLIPLGIQSLGLSQEMSGILFLFAAFGIGGGALIAGKLSGRNIELGVVPLGAALLFASASALGALPLTVAFVAVAVLILGIGGGLFIVPLHSFIQFRSPEHHRGKVLAATNFLGWCGVLLAALLTHLVNETLALQAQQGFLGMALFLLLITMAAFAILPDFLLRFVALVLMRAVYRVRVHGADNVPVEGGALLVANHVSWIDALILLSTQQRRIRFLMERGIYETFFVRHLFRMMGVIPISSKDGRRELAASLQTARKTLDDGYLVCIFAEGAITRTGALQEFRPGFEHIVKGSDHPVIPVHLGGIWGSIFSYRNGTILSTFPRAIPGPVVVSFAPPLPSTSTSSEVRQAVMELSCHDFELRKSSDRSLARRFVRSARRHWRRPAISDISGKTLTYGQTLVASLLLGDTLRKNASEGENVGVILPPTLGAALTNIALALEKKVPVNLNYTASREGLESAIRQAGIETIITSRKFMERLSDLRFDCRTVFLEDLLQGFTAPQKIRAWVRGVLIPASRLVKKSKNEADDLATIIFSSGSTSEPKGVVLSQHNICSNIEALNMVFSFDRKDNLCGVLPFFHSFGFTGTLWLPLINGFSVVYHPSPLDTGKIVRSIREHRSTFLLATPTFLSAYMRKAQKSDFESLRLVVTGAEKMSPQLASEFAEKFGVSPLEGYGATELSPVAAINLPDAHIGKVHQRGSRPESVGRPLPGMAVRIVDLETRETLPPNTDGMILLRGPNVMSGYLNQPEKTREVLKDGWYETGDIGCVDPQGFLKITGRLSRFSKIAGEMVPHGAVEEVLLRGLDTSEQVVAVTAIPDPKKGERLVVVYQESQTTAERIKEIMSESGLPNLWKPDHDGYIGVESIPLLGSGKLDLRSIRSLAQERCRG